MKPIARWCSSAGLIHRKRAALRSGLPASPFRRHLSLVPWHAVPVRAQDGSIVRWCNLSTDIEERKQAEDVRRSSERHAILDNIPGLVAIHKASGEPELFNRAARDTTAPAQTIRSSGRSPMSSIQTICRGSSRHAGARCRRASHSTPSRACGARMARIDVFWSGRSWSTTTTARLAGTALHRHPRQKMAEDALRQSEAFLLEVQRLSRTGGWRYDPATNVVESSPEIQRAYAVQPGEDISRPSFWFDRIHPEDRPRVQALFEQCMREKTDYRAGYRIVLPDGSIRYQYATGRPVTNDAGALVQFIGASMDMTEHWLATTELERASQAVRDLQIKMSRAAQIATVGELAASIAHEVNQPLAAVVANGHACLRWLAASPPNVQKAVEAAERVVKDGKDAGEVVRGYAPCSNGPLSKRFTWTPTRSFAKCFVCWTATPLESTSRRRRV